VNIGGTNNTVTETDLRSDRDFTINGGTGYGRFTLGNGNNTLVTHGAYNVIQMGTPDHPPYRDSVSADGDSNQITLGDGTNAVTANGNSDTIKVGGGTNVITANGAGDSITAGNGRNTITANGTADTITVGGGPNVLQANGNSDIITTGNGSNSITAGGDNDTITLGSGNNSVSATGNNDVITSAGGRGTFTLGSQLHTGQDTLTLNASAVGTTVDSEGTQNTIVLNKNANASITDSPFGGGLTLDIFASAGANAGNIKLYGFGADTTGVIDLQGFVGITNYAQLAAHSTSDGAGGTLIHLGTGSLDLVQTTINNNQFLFS
jgi:hypothetical protein